MLRNVFLVVSSILHSLVSFFPFAVLALNISCNQAAEHDDLNLHRSAVPYKILRDDMGTVIHIGLDSDVNEMQLRNTLVKAADDHQDDAARDYLTSGALWVEAYLLKNSEKSAVSAGRIRRHIPWKNPQERKKITADRSKGDEITITLDQAKRTMK
jgi:hypothetical protein